MVKAMPNRIKKSPRMCLSIVRIWFGNVTSVLYARGTVTRDVKINSRRTTVPTGKVKWYDTDKGFGFLATDEGEEVFLHASALPAGVVSLKNNTRVEFGVAEGKRGLQALSLRILEEPPSIAKSGRKQTEDMAIMLEDVIKLLDGYSNTLRRGRYPDDQQSSRLVAVLRAIADQLDV